MLKTPIRTLAVCATVVACNALTADSVLRERQPGIIRHNGDTIVFTVPDTVQVASSFEVTIRTYGDGCVNEGDTQVLQTENVADVVPFDIFVVQAGPNFSCTRELRHFSHSAFLQFLKGGDATVRVRGRSLPGDSVIFRERTIVVR